MAELTPYGTASQSALTGWLVGWLVAGCQPTNEPTNERTNQPTNQPTNRQKTCHLKPSHCFSSSRSFDICKSAGLLPDLHLHFEDIPMTPAKPPPWRLQGRRACSDDNNGTGICNPDSIQNGYGKIRFFVPAWLLQRGDLGTLLDAKSSPRVTVDECSCVYAETLDCFVLSGQRRLVGRGFAPL